MLECELFGRSLCQSIFHIDPRISRWRTDKKAEEADTLAALRRLLPPQS